MTEEDRQKLCADLRDPWAVTIEELAELAGVAADEIERLAGDMAYWKDAAHKALALAEQPAPASAMRWWARSKRAEGAK